MSESPAKDTRAQPAASPSIFGDNENKGASISNGTTGATTPTTNTTTNTIRIRNVYVKPVKKKATLYLSAEPWEIFKEQAAQIGYSASELLDRFIQAIVCDGELLDTSAKSPPTFNINLAIAKAEAKPTINVGEYIAEKQLDTIIAKVHALKKKAEKEQAGDTPLSFTVSRSKELEEDILRVLKGVRKLPPAKLEEVNAALTILRSIRGGA